MPEPHLERLNSLPAEDARREFLKCCGSTTWAEGMIEQRPFANVESLKRTSVEVWSALEEKDWLEAFHSHPKIGEKKALAPPAAEAQTWAEQEQSGTSDAAEETIAELARLNRVYEEKFGFIFIVCATGKTSVEMLALLRGRLTNTPEQELRNAAAEQAKITDLRFNKLLNL